MIQKIKDFFVVTIWGTTEKFINTTITRVHEIYDSFLALIKHILSDHKVLLGFAFMVLIFIDLLVGVKLGVITNLILAIKGLLEIIAVNLGAAILVVIGLILFWSYKK